MDAKRLGDVRRVVSVEALRVAQLGEWGGDLDPRALVARVPDEVSDGQGGFDAGIACALDLIPREHQRLAAQLHAAYTPAVVAQVREEMARLTADGDVTWWLAACSICSEGPVGAEQFLEQLDCFEVLRVDGEARVAAAVAQRDEMLQSFEVRDGVAWATRDGGMQGAYIAGYEVAVQFAGKYGLYFVGTFHASLGLDGFQWQDEGVEGVSLGRSGPVFGSSQFVKCADETELRRVLDYVQVRD
jgi:hypothetical protein